MQRSKKIVLVSHCVLNQNAVIEGWERARGAFSFVKALVEAGVGIVQLPCPETEFAGLSRPPRNYAAYDTPAYRKLCGRLAGTVVVQLREYQKQGVLCCGLIAIQNSPSCSVSGQRGVFMEELFTRFAQENIKMEYFEIPEEYQDGREAGFIRLNGLNIQY